MAGHRSGWQQMAATERGRNFIRSVDNFPMLSERGVEVDHTTLYRWVQRYAPIMRERLEWATQMAC